MTRLRKVSLSEPGFTRRRSGKGFRYLDADGTPLSDEDVQRCKELVIPPAWTDVWICRHPNGHLQAVGYDDAGRRQYLYHPQWRARRDAEKFERVIALAPRLPAARRQVARHLQGEPLSREQVLALAFRLLDAGLFRVGGEDYAATNNSFGLATLLREHVRVRGDEMRFEFPAKSGKELSMIITDRLAAPVVRALMRRRSDHPELLAYRIGRRWHDVTSADVNEHLKDLVADEFSAKDLRTWHATVLASVLFARHADAGLSKTARRRVERTVMTEVAESLGNTPAVARSAYVDPRVVELFDNGTTLPEKVVRGLDVTRSPQPPRVERAVVELLS